MLTKRHALRLATHYSDIADIFRDVHFKSAEAQARRQETHWRKASVSAWEPGKAEATR